jgi:transglutaminase superfamily protein
MLTRLRNWGLGARALLALALGGPARRGLWAEMRRYARGLPGALSAPLPQAVAAQTPQTVDLALPQADVRDLADAAALFERRSPLGLCLRRSMLRYHFLRRAGLPLVLNFGARFKEGQADREITGHAWVTLDGQPYHEDGENYQGFTVMLRFPANTPPRNDTRPHGDG